MHDISRVQYEPPYLTMFDNVSVVQYDSHVTGRMECLACVQACSCKRAHAARWKKVALLSSAEARTYA